MKVETTHRNTMRVSQRAITLSFALEPLIWRVRLLCRLDERLDAPIHSWSKSRKRATSDSRGAARWPQLSCCACDAAARPAGARLAAGQEQTPRRARATAKVSQLDIPSLRQGGREACGRAALRANRSPGPTSSQRTRPIDSGRSLGGCASRVVGAPTRGGL